MTEKFKSESKFFLVGKSTSETSITIHGKQTKFIFRDKHTQIMAMIGGGKWKILGSISFGKPYCIDVTHSIIHGLIIFFFSYTNGQMDT